MGSGRTLSNILSVALPRKSDLASNPIAPGRTLERGTPFPPPHERNPIGFLIYPHSNPREPLRLGPRPELAGLLDRGVVTVQA